MQMLRWKWEGERGISVACGHCPRMAILRSQMGCMTSIRSPNQEVCRCHCNTHTSLDHCSMRVGAPTDRAYAQIRNVDLTPVHVFTPHTHFTHPNLDASNVHSSSSSRFRVSFFPARIHIRREIRDHHLSMMKRQ